MRKKIRRVLVADIAGRVIPTAQKGSGGLAAELKRLAHVSRVIKEGAIGTDHRGADTIRHLTAEEIEAIHDYTCGGSEFVNTFLGGYSGFAYRRRPEHEIVSRIRELEEVLRKLPNYNGWVVRSFTANDYAHFSGVVRRYRVGKIITEPTFLSATTEMNWRAVPWGHNFTGSSVHFRWYSRTGKDISNYSSNDEEREILTAPNTTFKVKDIAAIPKRELYSIYRTEAATVDEADEVDELPLHYALYGPPTPPLRGVSLWIGLKEL